MVEVRFEWSEKERRKTAPTGFYFSLCNLGVGRTGRLG